MKFRIENSRTTSERANKRRELHSQFVITNKQATMKSQQGQTAWLLNAEIETAALTKLTGGALPIHPHDLVASANSGSHYDANNDDVLDELDRAPQP